jgi:Uncharacterized protein conserved in bacteria
MQHVLRILFTALMLTGFAASAWSQVYIQGAQVYLDGATSEVYVEGSVYIQDSNSSERMLDIDGHLESEQHQLHAWRFCDGQQQRSYR